MSCHIQGSKCVKYNGSHKTENHHQYRQCCKVNKKTNLPYLEMKAGAPCPHSFKCSNCCRDYQVDSNLCPFQKHRFYCEQHVKKYTKIHENRLIVNTILETQHQFNIIFIQEPPWSIICSIPSSNNCKEEPLVGISHHPNQHTFTRHPTNQSDSPRVVTYINICALRLCFSL